MSVQIAWDPSKCCHSANCVRTLPQVFMVQDGQFVIKPEAASEEEIGKVIAACPSAALSVKT